MFRKFVGMGIFFAAVAFVVAPALAQLEHMGKVRIYPLVVTVGDKEIRGPTESEIAAGEFYQPSGVFLLPLYHEFQMKVEIERPDGKRLDVTDSDKTSFRSSDASVMVTSDGVVKSLSPPARKEDVSIVVQYENINLSGRDAAGMIGSAVIMFRVVPPLGD